ncbi:MAG: ATP-binding protein, partial [Clostridia bacterium]|nr:ATP-binding protein [Clostridia bacterium]
MGYNKNNFKRIREEYETKSFRAEEEADVRREEVYLAVPELRELDARLSQFGLRIMKAALSGGDTEGSVAALREENGRIRLLRGRLLEKNGFPADYCEPRYECEQCRDTGYCGIKMCSCMRRSLIAAGMESSGLSALMHQQSFENFSLQYYRDDPEELRRMSETYAKLKSYANEFAIETDKPMPKSWLFLGGTGLGKTHLSTSVARVVIERGYDVYYNSAVGMISDFESKRFGNGLASGGADDTA